MRRNSGSFSFALEVANVGTTSTYKFELTGNMDQRLFFKTRELASRTNYFFTSVYKYIIRHSIWQQYSKLRDPTRLIFWETPTFHDRCHGIVNTVVLLLRS